MEELLTEMEESHMVYMIIFDTLKIRAANRLTTSGARLAQALKLAVQSLSSAPAASGQMAKADSKAYTRHAQHHRSR